jgi:hypothetical protein
MALVFNPAENQKENGRGGKSEAGRLKKKALKHPLVTDALEIFDGRIADVKILQEGIE